MMNRIFALILLAAGILAGPVAAQNMFAPVAKVNDSIITRYEQSQRARMLELFRFPGDPLAEATVRLIEEKLQVQEARRLGLSVSEAEIVAGEAEFASRANLDREKFIAALGQAGVTREALRDFVTAGLLWRKVLRAQFGPPNTIVSDDDIAREVARAEPAGGTRYLLTELVLKADTPENRAIARRRAGEIAEIGNAYDFEAAVYRFSTSATRTRAGRLEWLDAAALPEDVQRALAGLEVDQISPPIETEDSIRMFYLRDRRDVAETGPATQSLEYAAVYLDGGRSPETLARAAAITGSVHTCDELYPLMRNQPAERLERTTRPLSEIPSDIAFELAKLDAGEFSTDLTRSGGQTLVVLMLCQRLANPDNDIFSNRVGEALLNQQATGKGRILLADLKANAVVEVY